MVRNKELIYRVIFPSHYRVTRGALGGSTTWLDPKLLILKGDSNDSAYPCQEGLREASEGGTE